MKRIPLLIAALVWALLLGACAGKQVPVQATPTPFPTLPPTKASTPTAYVFTPAAGEQATPLPTPSITPPAPNSIPVDGELVSRYPPLEVAFPAGVSSRLLALHVRLGQKVKAGDLVATLDDDELQRAVQAAQLVLEEAKEAQAEAEREAEEKAERAYQRAIEEAQWALDMVTHNLRIAEMRPPTTAVAKAQVKVDRARDQEALAAEAYTRALDRPWEPQSVRDGLHKAWQNQITNRKLAELDLKDAQATLQVYYMSLEMSKQVVERADAKLAGIEKEVAPVSEEAVAQAERALADAQEQLTYVQLYAPRDGLVVGVNALEGSTVDSGTSIVSLVKVDDLYFVTINLDERHAALLRSGQQARITLRFYPDAAISGQVDAVIPLMGQQSGARFAAYIRLVDKGGVDLLPGMTGRAEIGINDR